MSRFSNFRCLAYYAVLAALAGCAAPYRTAWTNPDRPPPPAWPPPPVSAAQPAEQAAEPTPPKQPPAAHPQPPRLTGKPHPSAVKSALTFGGKRVGPDTPSLFEQAGGSSPSMFGWALPSAFASDPPTTSCSQDPFTKANGKSDPVDHNTADFLPGLNGVPWGGMVNGYFVALSGVAVLRSHTAPAGDTTIEVYPHWDTVTDKAAATPAISLPAVVRTYQAKDGFIYRAIVAAAGTPILCLDILIPYTGYKAISGRLHYDRGGTEYAAPFTPSRLTE